MRARFLQSFVLVAAMASACHRVPSTAARGSAGADGASASSAQEALRARLAAAPPETLAADDDGKELWAGLQRYYQETGDAPVWFDGSGDPRPQVAQLSTAVQRAEEDGLDPAAYPVPAVQGKRPSASAMADAEVRLSSAYLMYASDRLRGQVDPHTVDPKWFGTRPAVDPVALLKQAAEGDVAQLIATQAPQHPEYAALKQALARYRGIAEKGGWPALPESGVSRRGQRGPQVALLRARLAAEGDLAPGAPSDLYDDAVAAAVKAFEKRHGLQPDGALDKATIAALNVPAGERLRQIELNLERWRWLPETFGERYVMVNIPTYELNAFDHGSLVLQMPVVTGKKDSPTPIFNDEMTEVVFSPYWNIPTEILRKETIPAAMRDPGYLGRNDLEVTRNGKVVSSWGVSLNSPGVAVRQRPGPKNSLGLVKFLFPNQFDVYLHDTPADSLFSRITRDYSHGCVRVSDPLALAEWVLRDQPSWTHERIVAAMNAGVEKHVALKQHVPVYLLYTTVWVDGAGTVEFRDDVYGHDERQEKLLPETLDKDNVQVAEAR